MSINYLSSLILVILTCIASIKIISFININKIKNALFVSLFAITMFSFCTAYALELAASTIKLKNIFSMAKNTFFGFLPTLTLLIFMSISRNNKKLKPLHYFLLFIVPVINAVISLTSRYHNLYFYNHSIKAIGSLEILFMNAGIWFYIMSIYAVAMFSISFLILYRYLKQMNKDRYPIIILLSLIILSFVCIVGYIITFDTLISFLMPFFIPLACFMLSINYVTSKLFGVIPFAYKKAFEWSDSPILILDSELNLMDFNEEAVSSIPLLNENTITKNISDFIDYDGRIRSCIVTDSECRIRIIKDYDVRHYRVSSSSLIGRNRKTLGYMVSFIDVTELVETMAELTELASIDTLTRTHTRRYFIERTELEFARAKRHAHPLSFIILDLDHFKNINDAYGHIAGDVILKEVADICKTKIRSIDLLGRFGGEEFMMLLPETDLESTVTAAERIRKKIEETDFLHDGKVMKITASLGVTGTDKVTCESFDRFLHCADVALYKAKDSGRNKVKHELLG